MTNEAVDNNKLLVKLQANDINDTETNSNYTLTQAYVLFYS